MAGFGGEPVEIVKGSKCYGRAGCFDMCSYAAGPFRPEWKSVSSRWGHKLHSVCSYMAMFPPSLPHYFIEKCTRPGDMVIDPFSGRGTTALQACLTGRVGVGNDLNYLAYILTKAKVNVPDVTSVYDRLSELESAYRQPEGVGELLKQYRERSSGAVLMQQGSRATGEPQLSLAGWEVLRKILTQLRELYASQHGMPFYRDEDYEYASSKSSGVGYSPEHHHRIWLFFHPSTLHQLVFLRDRLTDDPADTFIKAVVLGIMHGRGRFYLSVPMPNTFSMTPKYVLAYSYKHRLLLPDRSLFDCLRAKLAVMGFPKDIGPTLGRYVPGHGVFGDVRQLPQNLLSIVKERGARPKLLVTSPPYLRVIKYGQYNWIRLWFLENDALVKSLGEGNHAELSETTDALLDDGHRDVGPYMDFMRESMEAAYSVMDDDSLSVWVIGDVEQKGKGNVALAHQVWEQAAKPAGWKILDIIADPLEPNRRVSKIWGESRGRATKTDRVLLLYKRSWPSFPGGVQW